MSGENWVQKTIGVRAITDRLSAEYDIGKVCSGDVYETAKAMMALAINEAANATGGTPRRKKRIVTKMASWIMNGAVAVFMLGYDTAMKEHSAALKEAANAQ